MRRLTGIFALLSLVAVQGIATGAVGCGVGSFVLSTPEDVATVVVRADAEASSRLAAEEFAAYVGKVTGRTPRIAETALAAGTRVVIGTLAKLPDAPAEAKATLGKSKSDESAWTGIRGNTLWIVGVGKVGELYATYRFLEKHLGIRWLKAANEHDDGEYVPRRERIVLKPFAEYDEPALAVRRIDSCGGVVTKIARNGRNWALRNGLQAPPPIAYVGQNGPKGRPELWEFYSPRTIDRLLRVGGGHPTFYGPITPEKYFKNHPEYFALVDGKRVPGKQLCITHPEVLRILRDSILRNFEESGGIGNFHFGLHDVTSGWCECERCRKLDGGEPYACGIPNISTRFNKMVKLVADEVWKVRPDALLSEWAYSTYREIPEGVRPDPRMRVQYCPHGRCYGHDLDDPTCARNTYLYDLLKKWIAITPGGVYTYDYYFAPPPPLYTCAEHVLAHDLKLYKKLGMTGWKDEEYFEDTVFIERFRKQYGPSVRDWYASNWQLLYVAGKLTWNPDLDVDKVLEDAESKYYGVAYPQMRKYHALRRRLWDAAPQCLGYPTGDQRRPNVLNQPGAKEELRALLAEAEKVGAADRTLAYRLSLDRRWLEDYWIKPNEELREKRSRSLFAPRMKGTVTVDGVGNEPDWAGACYVDQFAVPNDLWANFGPLPKELAVNVGILSDADSLYFLFNVKEPNVAGLEERFKKHDDPVWHDDGVELFLYPATAANQYFQIVVSTAGVVYDVAHPGCDPAAELGVEAAVKKSTDGFCVEVRVPAEKLLKLRDGDMWRCHFMRNRRVKDSLTPKAVSFAVDGVMPHDTVGYRTLTIGSAILKNGGFEDVKDGRPAGWSLTGKTALVEEGTGRMLRIDHGGATQLMWGGPLRQSDKPRKIEYSFKAKSAGGGVRVSFVRYTDTPDEKAPHGYRRKYHPEPGKGGDYRPKGDGLEFFSGEYTIAPNEWVGIQFSNVNATPCAVDDVAVFLVQ